MTGEMGYRNGSEVVQKSSSGSTPKKIKREVRRKALLLDILSRIEKNQSTLEIRKSYGWKKQRLTPYIRYLKDRNIICLKVRTNTAFYGLTEKGKVFWKDNHKYLSSSITLHSVQFKADIKNIGTLTPEKSWYANNLFSRMRRETNCTIKWYESTITFDVSHLFGDNSYKLIEEARNIVNNLVNKLEFEFGVKIGELKLTKKPHFAVRSPIANEFAKNITFESEDGMINASPPDNLGDFEFHTPEDAQSYIESPRKIRELETQINSLAPILKEIVDVTKMEIHNKQIHQKVLEDMLITLKEIRESLRR